MEPTRATTTGERVILLLVATTCQDGITTAALGVRRCRFEAFATRLGLRIDACDYNDGRPKLRACGAGYNVEIVSTDRFNR